MQWRKQDWLGAAATVFALAVTFNAEYEIATAVHIHPLVAYAVPGALDVYVLRALQVKRDVFLTVLAMVAVNAASHLVTAGVLAVSPVLIVAVSAIAPLVLWRAHVLRHSPRTEHSVPAAPEHALAVPTLDEHADQAVSVVNPGTVSVPEHWCGHGHDHGEHRHRAYDTDLVCLGVTADAYGVPEHDDLAQLERAWHRAYDADHGVPVWDGTVSDETSTGKARVLTLVADPEPGVLLDGDKEHIDGARALFESTAPDTPTLRALKTELKVSTDRARRVRDYLVKEAESTS